MSDTTLPELSAARPRANALGSLARRLVIGRLGRLETGGLRIREGTQVLEVGDLAAPRCATLTVHDAAFWAEVAYGGSVGAAESYMLGHWSADDLPALLAVLLRNRPVLDGLERGLARMSSPARTLAHWLHRNTRAGSRRNIAAHYDVGNDLFALFLDETMMYSCALFERAGMSLAQASVAKLEAVCRKLELGPGDRVLEIGTGWGGFAIHAARTRGCHVTTTTISPSQHALASERVRAAGLGDRVTILLEDYRDLRGRFDKLVSIEMIEAIGHRQFETFFARCAGLLDPRGRMLLQSITIADRHYRRARDEVDFVKRHVFPGCCIPSVGALSAAMTAASDLRLVHLEDIGAHYARTLAEWRRNFMSNLDRVRALGYPETFCRLWEFYFAYCEAGFAERALGDVQMVLTREG